MTHAELVERAGRWLRSLGYGTVVTERLMGGVEEPDAIGWKASGFSMVVECKVSVEDFRRDARKPHRAHPELGMGHLRVYLTPPGLIQYPEFVPLNWGLAEAGVRGVRVVNKPQPQLGWDRFAELRWLIAYTRRREGVSKRLRQPTGEG